MKSHKARSIWLLFANLICMNSCSQRLEAECRCLGRKAVRFQSSQSLDSTIHRFRASQRNSRGLYGLRGGSAPPGQIIQCAYSREWDNQGVLFLLGTMPPLPSQGTWFNPAQIGRARIHCGNEGYIGISDIDQPEVQLDPAVVIDRWDNIL